jgi:hypothetical protein
MNKKNDRQKYIKRLQGELTKAARSQEFVNSEGGKYVISYIGELISSLTNNLVNKRKTHEEYIELRAQIDILRKLKQVLELQANETVIADLSAQIQLAETE